MEIVSKFFTEVINVLKAMSGYLQDPSYELWTVIKKDEVVFGQNEKKVYLKGDTTAEDVLNSFGWTANPIEESFVNFVILYLSTYGLADCYRIEIYNRANPRIDFTVNRKGKTDQLVVVQKEGKVFVYYGELIVATSSSYDYELLTYVGKFIKQLNSPVCISGQPDIWTIIRCCDLLNYFTNDVPFKDFTYNVIVAACRAKLFIKYKDNVLLEVLPGENGKVEVGTTPFNKTEMSVRQLIAVMIDFGPMLETIKGMKIIGEFNRAAAFSHFYMLQELLKIILPFEGEKSICIGDRDRPPFVVISNYMITIDLYTNAISWYNIIKTECPAEWKAAPIEDAYVVLKESLALPVAEPEAEQDEQRPAITKEDIEKCEVKAEPEPEEEPEDAQEEEEDTEEDSDSEDESCEGEEDSSEDDDEWDSDDSEEDDDDLLDEDDEEEEEDAEDSEDDEDEDDEDSDSDDGDDESESDNDNGSEESVEQSLVTRSLSSICSFMFARVFPMFTGQPGSKLEIKDKGDTVIVSWPGSPCPVQLTLTGYPKDSKNPEGSWLFEATASFKDRTFSTDPQSLIECVNDYKETLEALTSAPSK